MCRVPEWQLYRGRVNQHAGILRGVSWWVGVHRRQCHVHVLGRNLLVWGCHEMHRLWCGQQLLPGQGERLYYMRSGFFLIRWCLDDSHVLLGVRRGSLVRWHEYSDRLHSRYVFGGRREELLAVWRRQQVHGAEQVEWMPHMCRRPVHFRQHR